MSGTTPSENVSRIEPCLLDSLSPEIADAAAELASASTALTAALHPRTAASLAELVRVMNCYYSNLIEGHATRLRDLERALADRIDEDPARKRLQLEARDHIEVQRKVDHLFEQHQLPEPTSVDFIRWLHREFYARAPIEALTSSAAGRTVTMVPGEFRSGEEHDVAVGRHVPPASNDVARFMDYFAQRYAPGTAGKAQRIVAIAAAHHRFNYIHPFVDGNGRVSRLMSHAMGLTAGVGAHGLWSVSRGLARGLAERDEYKQMMAAADSPRQGDFDGRGNLSQQRLAEFVHWFVRVCLDQVRFMSTLFDLPTLSSRLGLWVGAHRSLAAHAVPLIEEVFRRGELARGEVARVTGSTERTARRTLATLLEDGLLASDTPRGNVHLVFQPATAPILFPGLYEGGA